MIKIHERETPFGLLEVMDYDNVRGIFIDGVCQGRTDLISGPVSWYMREVVNKVRNYDKRPDKILMLGGGACILPKALEFRGFEVDVVEQSADMIEVAEKYFDYYPVGKLIHGDAFKVLKDLGKYDCIIYDLFNGLIPPAGPSFYFDECLEHLKPHGHFLVNLINPANNKQYVAELTDNGQ